MIERLEAWMRGSVRWCTGACIAGVVIIIVAAASLNSQVFLLGILLGLLGALVLATQPLGFALSAGLRAPGLLPDRMRLGAAIAGLGALALGWRVISDGRVEKGSLIAGLLIVVGVIGVGAAVRPPRVRSWQVPVSVIVAGLLVAVFSHLPAMFAGTKPKAYYLQMQSMAEEIQRWQEAMKADSGRYLAQLDTSMLRDHRWGMTRPRVEITADGYRAWTTSPALDSSFVCGVYAGSTLAAPATHSDTVMCTMYPNYELQQLSLAWLFGVVLTGFAGLGVRRWAMKVA